MNLIDEHQLDTLLQRHGPDDRDVGRLGRQLHRGGRGARRDLRLHRQGRRRRLRRALHPRPAIDGRGAGPGDRLPRTRGRPDAATSSSPTTRSARWPPTWARRTSCAWPTSSDRLIARSEITYVEGYLYDLPPAKEAIQQGRRLRPRARLDGGAVALGHVLRRSAPPGLPGPGDPRRRRAARATRTRSCRCSR